ncbi:MAG: AMP-binding protein, partial [Pseudonocardiaceae bacterium]
MAELFAAQACDSPEAVAVVCGEDRLSYGQLDAAANRLAWHLQRLGVGPEVVVGVCLERGVGLVVGLLGALKAGGAYLPLDPGYPAARLGWMLSDAQVGALVTTADLADRLPVDGVRLVCLDADRDAIAGCPEVAPPNRATSQSLAYVIYTSGSTGRPKGVAVAHRGLANLCAWHRRAYQVGPHDRATQLASPGFDAAVWELWPYLVAGASVHLPGQDIVTAPAELVGWLAANQISVTFLPTPLAEAVLAEPGLARLAGLRAMLTGGDALRRRPPDGLGFGLVNHYGPTEATVVATAADVADLADVAAGGAPPPIGRPIANTRVYVLDRWFNV